MIRMLDFKSYLDVKNYDIFLSDTDMCLESDAIFVITRSFIQKLKQTTTRKFRCRRYKGFISILNKFEIAYIERNYNELRNENIDLEKVKADVIEPKDCNPKWIIVNKVEFIPLLRYYIPFRVNSEDLLYSYSQYLSNSEKDEKKKKRRIEVL